MSLQHRQEMAKAFSNQYGYSSGAAFVLCDIARECQHAIAAKIDLLFSAPIGSRRDKALSEIDDEIKQLLCAAQIVVGFSFGQSKKLAAFERFIKTVELSAVNWALSCFKGRRLP